MYRKPFFITEPIWNNAFSFKERTNKKLYVPNLIKIKDISEIELWEEIVFEDYDFNMILQSCTGLKNFYELDWNWKKVFLFDNHNHAFYFWYLAREQKLIWDDNLLYHVDEHSDMRDPWNYLSKPGSYDLEKIFNFTNFELNVWNYIIPWIEEGIIKEVIQIRNEENLLNFDETKLKKSSGIILNLDLDFFEPELDFIDYNLKKDVILKIVNKADIITVATSPFFIEQDLALWVFKDIFN